MSTPEAGLRERILAAIRQDYPPRRSGVLVFGRPASGSTGAGHPDLFGVALGRFFGLEIKMPGGKPTDMQVARIRDLRSCGACVWIVRSPLAAVRAIFQVKQGVAVMPDEPMDFDDWLKGLDLPAAAPEIIEVTASPTEHAALSAGLEVVTQDEPVIDFDPLPETPGSEASPTLEGEFTIEGEDSVPGPKPSHPAGDEAIAAVDRFLAVTPEEFAAAQSKPAKPTVDDLQAARDAGLLGADKPEPTSFADLSLEGEPMPVSKVDMDVRAVGDRVTEVWEAMHRLSLQQSTTFKLLVGLAQEVVTLREQMNDLLKEIDVAGAVRPVEFEVPTPLDDVLPPSNGAQAPAPADAIRRRRTRKAN